MLENREKRDEEGRREKEGERRKERRKERRRERKERGKENQVKRNKSDLAVKFARFDVFLGVQFALCRLLVPASRCGDCPPLPL